MMRPAAVARIVVSPAVMAAIMTFRVVHAMMLAVTLLRTVALAVLAGAERHSLTVAMEMDVYLLGRGGRRARGKHCEGKRRGTENCFHGVEAPWLLC